MPKLLIIISLLMTIATIYACTVPPEKVSEISGIETCSGTVQLQ